MSDIKVVRKHHLTIAQAKKIAQKAADDLASEYDLQSDWDGDTLVFSRSGVEGEMAVTAGEIRLDVKLGFLLKAFKGKFEQHIGHRLDELLYAADVAHPATHAKVAKAAGAAKAPGSGKTARRKA